jgi:hypothetical protein
LLDATKSNLQFLILLRVAPCTHEKYSETSKQKVEANNTAGLSWQWDIHLPVSFSYLANSRPSVQKSYTCTTCILLKLGTRKKQGASAESVTGLISTGSAPRPYQCSWPGTMMPVMKSSDYILL